MAIPAGIPDLLNGVNDVFGNIIEANAIVNLVDNFLGGVTPQWGIYLPGSGNQPTLAVDSFLDFSIQNASQVANYRIEKGQFASYNKVDTPYNLSVLAVKSGNNDEFNTFLGTLETISNDLKLYDIVTPSKVYSNANIESYAYRRNPEAGANILYVQINFVQIMITDETQFNQPTKTQAGQKVESIGGVQTFPVTTSPPPVFTPI